MYPVTTTSKILIVTSAVIARRHRDIDTSVKLIEFSGQRVDQRKGEEMTSWFVEAIVRTSWLQSCYCAQLVRQLVILSTRLCTVLCPQTFS